MLLILAGVAISSLVGEESIIQNANNAVGKYNSQAKEEGKLLNSIEKYFIEYAGDKEENNTSLTVTATEGILEMTECDSHEMTDLFNYDENAVSSVICKDTSKNDMEIENTNVLVAGTHIIECTVTNEAGETATATKTVEVSRLGRNISYSSSNNNTR